jgi:hypothetical protein
VITLVGVLGLPGAVASAATWVSYPALLKQVRSGPLIRVIINPNRSDVEIKFRDLSEWHAFYPRSEQPALQRLVRARHIRLLFTPRPHLRPARVAAVHHHLRYIAAGVIAVLIAIGGVVLLNSRRGQALRARAR